MVSSDCLFFLSEVLGTEAEREPNAGTTADARTGFQTFSSSLRIFSAPVMLTLPLIPLKKCYSIVTISTFKDIHLFVFMKTQSFCDKMSTLHLSFSFNFQKLQSPPHFAA